jgi:outer membrane receptor for ferrienterochelin and colicin
MKQAPLGLAIALILSSILFNPTLSSAQIQQGTIVGRVIGPDGAAVADGRVTLLDQLGNALASTPVSNGQFRITNVTPGTYALRADAPPLHGMVQALSVAGALPVQIEMRLSATLAERVDVSAEAAQPVTTTTRVTLAGEAVRRAPVRIASRGLQDAVATIPGWAKEDNGLLHARGVDDGFLYVVDGVPVYERMDSVFGVAPDLEMVDSLNVMTGYVPPEFGFKSGGVIEVRSSNRTSDAWVGNVQGSAGSEATRQLSTIFGGPLPRSAALTFGLSGQTSSRFLDPVHPDNLHNHGRALNGSTEFGWNISPGATLDAVAGFGGSDFDVPNTEEQEDAKQDQRQRNRQTWQTVSWQKSWGANTVSQVAGYHRLGSAALIGSPHDTPLFANADRSLRRVGVLASVTHHLGPHMLKAGGETSRLNLREDFSFHVTNLSAGREAGLSDAALAHTAGTPFVFQNTAAPTLLAVYVQDSIQAGHGLTVDLGVRGDRSRMLTEASQWSPRLGLAYRLPDSTTTFRASFDRFFQPPQAENLLLGSSEQARALSPFAEGGTGGEDLQPERQTAIEAAVNQTFAHGMRVDVSYWRRAIDNPADPNVLFGTTLIFPNTVARGRAAGVDVRIELPRRRGLSAFLSYTNSRVVQWGPVTGGLFLEEQVAEIENGTRFTPDHDQRNIGAFGVTYDHEPSGFWMSLDGRYESGTPLEVNEDNIDELLARPGSELIDLERGRVRARQVFDVVSGFRLLRRGGGDLNLRVALINAAGRRFAYNFGNPFSGTHFGADRTLQIGLQARFGKKP